MLFSSITFLYFFLPTAVLIYKIAPRCAKNLCLCILSCLFYAWGEPAGVFLMLGQIAAAFILTTAAERKQGTKAGRILYVLSVFVPFVFLFYYKYSYFFLHRLLPDMRQVTLPIGISFYTFQLVSYIVDVHRGRVRLQTNPVTLAAFVTLFPQLIAGPIVRYSDIEQELADRQSQPSDFADGCVRFTVGLTKKVLLANVLGEFVTEAADIPNKGILLAWAYAAAVAMQLYFDFSGYSDMAIGLGRMFGFHFPENFRYPFMAQSATEFWRRWHITLGAWFRDYVYIPLGGNRVRPFRWAVNILLVWFLTGLWHGAGWNYIIWGLGFGILLLLEKWAGTLYADKVSQVIRDNRLLTVAVKILRHGYMIVIILISFLIFHNENLQKAWQDITGLFSENNYKSPLKTELGNLDTILQNKTQVSYILRNRLGLLVIAAIGTTSLPHLLWDRYAQKYRGKWNYEVLRSVGTIVLLLLCTAYLIDGSFNPFLYFRF